VEAPVRFIDKPLVGILERVEDVLDAIGA